MYFPIFIGDDVEQKQLNIFSGEGDGAIHSLT